MVTTSRFTLVLLLALLLASCAPSTGLPPRPSPVQNGGLTDSNYANFLASAECHLDLQASTLQSNAQNDLIRSKSNACYDLSLQLDPETSSYTGTLDLAFLNESARDISDLVFRLYPNTVYNYAGNLTVNLVKISGRPVETELLLNDQSALRVPLPVSLKPGESIQLTLEFQGSIPDNSSTYGIFNHDIKNNVITLADWYPILAARDSTGWIAAEIQPQGDAVTSETGLYHVSIRLPVLWKVAATGSDIENAANGSDQTIEIVSGPVREFMIAASPNFEVVDLSTQMGMIHQWILAGYDKEQIDSLQVIEHSMELFSEQFGEYPFTELDVVTVDLNKASGVEYPGLVLIEHDLYNPKADLNLLATVLTHEVAHQWWFNLVGNDVQRNPWQDEALATVSALLYFDKYNRAYMNGTIQYFQNTVQEFEATPGSELFQIGNPLSTFHDEPRAYSTIVYRKGALFLWELRNKIGAQAFDQALQDYFQQNEFQLVQPDALLRAFENQCNCDLKGFYQGWGVIK
ncbi:MAG TPA: M1 family metallopeptidase [Longilinea sp.]|nr:M1 family metallopeptidase [Longilinea sp.]